MREHLVVPVLVLGELDYWCRQLGLDDACVAFLDDVDAGAWRVEAPTAGDLRRARDLQAEYRDLAIGVVDATVISLVERLHESKVATLDHRHFAAVRVRHTAALTLLP